MENTPYNYKIKMIILIIFFIGIIISAVYLGGDIYTVLKDPAALKNLLNEFAIHHILMFILLQIMQVIIFIIPGELIEIMAGYLFGTTMGSIYSIVGITIGSAVSFFIARLLGYDFVRKVAPEQMFNRLDIFVNEDKRSGTVLFLLFLIPGLPKDALAYFAGITPIGYLNFIFISMFARLPTIVFSVYIGANIGDKNYTIAFIVAVIASITFLIGFIYRDKIINKLYQI